MMRAVTLSEVRNDAPDTLKGQLFGDVCFSTVTTDSRKVDSGNLFIALSGENFDGNQFVDSAIEQGAVGFIANNQPASNEMPCWLVDDTQRALAAVAKYNRQLFSGAVIGITGSAGKTTIKQMVGAILAQQHMPLVTKGNFNNEIGVPLTLLDLNSKYDVAVIEMGAAKQGDIAYLCDMVLPDIALVNNARPAHLEGFKTLLGVAKGKGEIYQALTNDGVAIINKDEDYFELWSELASAAKQLNFSADHQDADVFISAYQVNSDLSHQFKLHYKNESVLVHLKLLGYHNVRNAIAAASVCIAAGCKLHDVAKGLSTVEPVVGRMSTVKLSEKLCIVDDSYNANPGSVLAAADFLAQLPNEKTFILGDMAELGCDEREIHSQVIEKLLNADIDHVIYIGKHTEHIIQQYSHKSLLCFKNLETFVEQFAALGFTGTVLVKGSRSAKMENVVAALQSYQSGEVS